MTSKAPPDARFVAARPTKAIPLRRVQATRGIADDLFSIIAGTSSDGRNQARDARMVLYFYGFGGRVWPTLEDTAQAFGLGTRERVRQILSRGLDGLTRAGLPPTLEAASRLIRAKPFWVAHELGAALAEQTGDEPDLCVRAFLSLMHELGLARSYQAYDHNLVALTRSRLANASPYIVARQDVVPVLSTGLSRTRKLAAKIGMVSGSQLEAMLEPEIPGPPIMALMSMDPSCWIHTDGEDVWCALETPQSPLVALTARAFAAVEKTSSGRLALAIHGALVARAGRELHAGPSQLEAWIQTSRWFRQIDGCVVFLGQPGPLNRAEDELVRFLSDRETTDYAAIKAHLSERGESASAIARTATQSPVIHVDRSGGMRSHRYSLVGRPRLASEYPGNSS